MSRKFSIPNITINDNGDIVFNTNVVVEGGFIFGASVTVDINANTHNLLIPDLSSDVLIRLNFTGNYSLTGLVPNDVTQSQWLVLSNVGGGNGSFKSNDANSDPENRFLLGADKTIQTNEGIALVYDTIDLRWRSFGIQI